MKTYEEILAEMQAHYRALCGFDADSASDIGIRLKVLARQAYALQEQMMALRGQVFPQTATGAYLDLHAETRGIARKGALPAAGVLRFARETPAGADVQIAQGVLCTTRPDPQVRVETIGDAVLAAGETWVDVPARAVEAGAQGNVAADAVCLMITPAPGITAVRNPEPFAGGADAEDDDALRARLLQSFRNISNGTNRAFYYDLAMQHDGVKSVRVLPRRRERGTVDVVVAARVAEGADALLDEIRAELGERREINVDVAVLAARPVAVAVSAEVTVREGFLPEAVTGQCRARIASHIEALGVGEPLLRAALCGELMQLDGVYNCALIAPARDVTPEEDQVLAADEILVTGVAAL